MDEEFYFFDLDCGIGKSALTVGKFSFLLLLFSFLGKVFTLFANNMCG